MTETLPPAAVKPYRAAPDDRPEPRDRAEPRTDLYDDDAAAERDRRAHEQGPDEWESWRA